MQLGELQNQIDRFTRRNASIVAISVDSPTDSLAMLDRLGLTYPLASDPQQQMVKAYRVQNPDTQELALHAVYIVDEQRTILYRKVALRRPTSNELIDAIDAHHGRYPQADNVEPRRRANVAYPQNNFQAILEIVRVTTLPPNIDAKQFASVLALSKQRKSDDALIAYKQLMAQSTQASPEELLATASWITRQVFFTDNDGEMQHRGALILGEELAQRLSAISQLNDELKNAANATVKDQVLQRLSTARALLAKTQASISNQADSWSLRFVKTSIRSFREVARAATRKTESVAR